MKCKKKENYFLPVFGVFFTFGPAFTNTITIVVNIS